jgi:hypothetical protein
MTKLSLFAISTCIVIVSTSFFVAPAKNTLLRGKGFSYRVYCSPRDSFYLVELYSSVKYFWAGKLVKRTDSDTLASAKDTYLIWSEKSFKLIHKDFIHCKLKPVEQDSTIYNHRKSLFGSYFQLHGRNTSTTDSMTYQQIFEKYDQFGILDIR